MIFYLVKGASELMSNRIFKSQKDAILSQRWRIEDSSFDSEEDYPLTIMLVDTNLELITNVAEISRDLLLAKIVRYENQKKGGHK